MNYWHLELWDGEIIKVKPDFSDYIQGLMTKGAGSIRLKGRSVPIKNIKDFRESEDKVPQNTNLLEGAEKVDPEGAHQALKIPMTNKDGEVKCKWVKKHVTKRAYETTYGGNHSPYRKLSEDENGIVVAFILPVHLIHEDLTELTEAEVNKVKRS